jgi:uncharacterized cupin superfamily protein
MGVSRLPNVYQPEWQIEQDRPPFSWRRARIGGEAGAKKLGASLYELPPGASTFPLHFHHANEEMILVLEGRASVAGLDGERELEGGDVLACPAGRAGAHRVDNRSSEPVRLLILSTMISPEIAEYPESGKVFVHDWYGAEASTKPPEPVLLNRRSENLALFDEEATAAKQKEAVS